MAHYRQLVTHTLGTVDLIHAHSPAEVARQAIHLASFWKVRLIYEVRGFWSLSKAADDGVTADIDEATAVDSCVARNPKVHHVVAICQGVADQLVRQHVCFRKISIIPNGVDTSRFRPQKKDEELLNSLRLRDRFVFGYVTHVRRLEGLQCAIRAWPAVVKAIPEAVFVLVGTGPYFDVLKRMASDQGLGDTFRFIGQVPHTNVLSYYSLFDAFVVPRASSPVSHVVTPLKPLEAMAMGIPVIISRVAALEEIVRNGQTGLSFEPDDPDSLVSVCTQISRDGFLRKALATAARAWVEQERDWKIIAARYSSLYSALLGS